MPKVYGAPIAMTTARFRQAADVVAVVESVEDIVITVVVLTAALAGLFVAAELVMAVSCLAAGAVARMVVAETVISVVTVVASAGLPEQVAPVDAADSPIALVTAHSSIVIGAVAAAAAIKDVIRDTALDRGLATISALVLDKVAAAAMAAY